MDDGWMARAGGTALSGGPAHYPPSQRDLLYDLHGILYNVILAGYVHILCLKVTFLIGINLLKYQSINSSKPNVLITVKVGTKVIIQPLFNLLENINIFSPSQ